jgi:hypothetical protein
MAEIIKNQWRYTNKSAPENNVRRLRQKPRWLRVTVAEEILRYANENEIDLILVASHSTSGIERWGLGSVAEKIVYGGNTSVLLVSPVSSTSVNIYDWTSNAEKIGTKALTYTVRRRALN